jgi:DNA-binding SARP family transcriptional activator
VTNTLPFVLRTLGTVALVRESADGQDVLLRASKPLALLIYLASHVGRPLSRDMLADLLWGDETPQAARASLRQAVHSVRRLLGPDALRATREEVTLTQEGVTFDVERFESATEAGSLGEVADWYRGPFGARLAVRGALGFEQWMLAERERLRRRLLAASERFVADAIASGRHQEAASYARGIVVAEPTYEPLVLVASDALITAGDFAGAQLLLEGFRARLVGEGEAVPVALQQRLDRIHGVARERARVAPTSREALGRRFVGRDEAMTVLFRALEDARLRGVTKRLMLVGPPGMGKSRALDEFEARLRPRGTRVARIRLLQATREIPGSGLAAVVRALCGMSGAMGISERSASTIVTMLPELREQFAAAPVAEGSAGDIVRQRGEALRDLLGAVAEERLLVLLFDDDQNLDAASRAILEDGLSRPDLRLLEVRASRRTESASRMERYLLPPLGRDDVRELLAGEGTLPPREWVEPLIARLIELSAGIPQLILQQLRALHGRGLLVLQDGEWVGDAEGLQGAAADAGDLETFVTALSPLAVHVLSLLAVWRQPVPEVAIAEMMTREVARRGTKGAGLREALAELEWTGLAGARPAGWGVAHDTIVDVTLRRLHPGEATQLLLQWVQYWSRPGRLTLPVVEHLALLCGSRGEREVLRRVARAASRERQLRRIQLGGAELAARIATTAGHPEWQDALFRSMRWLERTPRQTVLTLGVAGGALLVAGAVLANLLWPRLVVESIPMPDGQGAFHSEMAVQPRIGVYDGFGRKLTNYQGNVLVSVRNKEFRFIGDTVRPIEDGSAQFERLGLEHLTRGKEFIPDSLVFVFRGPRFTRSVSVSLPGASYVFDFRIIKLLLNGEPVDIHQRQRLPVRDSVEITLTYEFSTPHATANYIVGAAPSWEPRERASIRLAGLPRPVRGARQTRSVTVPGASAPGLHHFFVLMATEGRVENIFSATNWVIETPIWNDGNDVADLSLEQRRGLRDSGQVHLRVLTSDTPFQQADIFTGSQRITRPRGLNRFYVDVLVLGTALEIEFVDLGVSGR